MFKRLIILSIFLFLLLIPVSAVDINNGTIFKTNNSNCSYYMADDFTFINVTTYPTSLNINGANITTYPSSGWLNMSMESLSESLINFTNNATVANITIQSGFANFSVVDGYNYTVKYQSNSSTYQEVTASLDEVFFTSIPAGSWYISDAAIIIANLHTVPYHDSVKVVWNTNIPTNNKVLYGRNPSLADGHWSSWSNNTNNIALVIQDLNDETLYYYQAYSQNQTNPLHNSSSSIRSFTTLEYFMSSSDFANRIVTPIYGFFIILVIALLASVVIAILLREGDIDITILTGIAVGIVAVCIVLYIGLFIMSNIP